MTWSISIRYWPFFIHALMKTRAREENPFYSFPIGCKTHFRHFVKRFVSAFHAFCVGLSYVLCRHFRCFLSAFHTVCLDISHGFCRHFTRSVSAFQTFRVDGIEVVSFGKSATSWTQFVSDDKKRDMNFSNLESNFNENMNEKYWRKISELIRWWNLSVTSCHGVH